MRDALRLSATMFGVLALSGCCMGGSPFGQATGAPATCAELCARILACHAELSAEPRASERDCTAACLPDGVYGRLPPRAWACSDRAECSEVWACTAVDMMTTPAISSVPGAPEDWPPNFPMVPGGYAVRTAAMGPVHGATLAYLGRAPSDLAAEYRAALEGGGWVIPEGGREHDETSELFIALRENQRVSVSIYREGEESRVQTTDFGSLFPR